MAFYRFTRACRQVIINYLQGQFSRSEKHWDGSDWIELPEIRVIDAAEYQPRLLPAVVTDTAMGNMRTLSFNQVIHPYRDTYGLYGPRNATYQVFGGRGDFDITLFCGANDRDLQQKLVDVATVYLTIGRGWIWYYRFVLLGDVRILGDGVEGDVSEERIWFANLTVPATADWRLIMARDAIQRIDLDVELVTPDDPFEDPKSLLLNAPKPTDKVGVLTPMDPEDARERLAQLEDAAQAEVPTHSREEFMMETDSSTDLPLRPMRGSKHTGEDGCG